MKRLKMRPAARAVLSLLPFLMAGSFLLGRSGVLAGSSTEIQACKESTTGLLRVVADFTECLPNETPISWNVQGLQGPPGSPGSPGPPGPAGPGLSGQFRVRMNDNQIFSVGPVVDGAYKAIRFDSTDFDEASSLEPGTDRFIAPSDGYYFFAASVIFRSSPGYVELVLAKNSVTYNWLDKLYNNSDILVLHGSELLFLHAGDTVELFFWTDAPNTPHVLAFNPWDADTNRGHTAFWGWKVG